VSAFLFVGSFGLPEPVYTHRLPSSAVGLLTSPKHGAFGDSDSASFRTVTFSLAGSSGYWIGSEITPQAFSCVAPFATSIVAAHTPVSGPPFFSTHPVCFWPALGSFSVHVCGLGPLALVPPPGGPVGPVGPTLPSFPVGPVAPVAPVAPLAPVPPPSGPVAPFSPVAPF